MDRDYELQTHQAEDRHWWYRGRRNGARAGDRRACACRRARGSSTRAAAAGATWSSWPRHGTVTGIELSGTSVELARERGSARSSKARCWRCRSRPSSFDLAASLDVIEHLEDDLAALRELRRVGGARAARCWSPCRPTNGCGAGTTRSTTTTAATRAARCSASASRRAGSRSARRTSTRCCCLSRSCCACSTASTARRPSRASTCGCRRSRSTGCSSVPLPLESALIARGGRIPAGLSLLACSASPRRRRAATGGGWCACGRSRRG